MPDHIFKINKLVDAATVCAKIKTNLSLQLFVDATIDHSTTPPKITFNNQNVHGSVTCAQHDDGTTDILIHINDIAEPATATHPTSNFILPAVPITAANMQNFIATL